MTPTQTVRHVFTSRFLSTLNLPQTFMPVIGQPLAQLLAVNHIERYYREALEKGTEHFLENVMSVMNLSIIIEKSDLLRIPQNGPAVIVANHPFGGIEGILLGSLLQKRRADFKILANRFLDAIPELQSYVIAVDVFKGKDSTIRNMIALRKALDWVRDGHLLVVFPAGIVSHFQLEYGIVADPPWQNNVTRLIQKTGAPVTPVYFAGHNKLGFQVAGLVHPFLRTLRLPWELVNKRNQSFEIAVGKPIPFQKLNGFKTIRERTHYLRLKTYNLANRYLYKKRDASATSPDAEPIADELPLRMLLVEINQLPPEQILLREKGHSVFLAQAEQIPSLLYEIGRLRESAFRLVGEGSGKSLDLDEYDFSYIHLIAWDEEKHKIIGAYRLGLVDRILKRHGSKGLYTTSLFHLKTAFVSSLQTAIEMGRSFVNPVYQRQPNALFLLWRGIGAFVAKHPQYRKLFGMVSISNAYHPASQLMIMEFLKKKHWESEWADFVKGKNGHKLKLKLPFYFLKEIEQLWELDSLVGDVEHEMKGIPVLIRQYLKLGAKFVAFNRDENFNDVLDGLLVVDLLQSEPRILKKYLGKKGQKNFYAYYGVRADES